MSDTKELWRTGAMYTLTEAARLSHVSTPTVKRWLQGYNWANGSTPPLFGDAHDQPLVSFLQLIEIVMAKRFRTRHVSAERIRFAHANARRIYRVEFPFAHLRLKAWAGHILRMMETEDVSLPALDAPGLNTLPGLVQEAMEAIDYEDDLAARWYPLGKIIPIVVDPRHAAGLPTIQNRNITVEHIKARFDAGQSIGFICRDLTLSHSHVEQAIRYADKVAA